MDGFVKDRLSIFFKTLGGVHRRKEVTTWRIQDLYFFNSAELESTVNNVNIELFLYYAEKKGGYLLLLGRFHKFI